MAHLQNSITWKGSYRPQRWEAESQEEKEECLLLFRKRYEDPAVF